MAWCLAEAGIEPAELDAVAYSYDPDLAFQPERRHHRRRVGGAAHALRAPRAAVPHDVAARARPRLRALGAAPRRARRLGDVRLRLRSVQRARARRPRRARLAPRGALARRRARDPRRAAAAALARAALRGAHRAPRVPPLVRRVQGDGDGFLRGARVPGAVPRAGPGRRQRRVRGRRRRPRGLRAGAGAGRRVHAASRRARLLRPAAARGGAARPRRLAARADRRPRPRDGRRRGAQLRRQLAAVARRAVRARSGSSRRRATPAPRSGPRCTSRTSSATRRRRCTRRRSGAAGTTRRWRSGSRPPRSRSSARTTWPTRSPRRSPTTRSSRGSRAARSSGRARWATARCSRTRAGTSNLEKLNDIKGREQFRPVAPMVLAERAARDLRRRPDPEPVHALHAPRARRLGGAHPGGRARRRHRADPDRRPRGGAADGALPRALRGAHRRPGRGQHEPQHRGPPDGRRPARRAGVLRLVARRPAGDRPVRGPQRARRSAA